MIVEIRIFTISREEKKWNFIKINLLTKQENLLKLKYKKLKTFLETTIVRKVEHWRH